MGSEASQEFDGSGQDVSMQIAALAGKGTLSSVEIWTASCFSRSWYEDARTEAAVSEPNARRREIIFAVCCAECYLFEWVRDEILRRDYQRLTHYFPIPDKDGIYERWRRVTRALREECLIRQLPDDSDAHGPAWNLLLRYRNGLTHASASRPDATGQSEKKRPTPSPQDLELLEPGWAMDVVAERIRRLHTAARSLPPDWL